MGSWIKTGVGGVQIINSILMDLSRPTVNNDDSMIMVIENTNGYGTTQSVLVVDARMGKFTFYWLNVNNRLRTPIWYYVSNILITFLFNNISLTDPHTFCPKLKHLHNRSIEFKGYFLEMQYSFPSRLFILSARLIQTKYSCQLWSMCVCVHFQKLLNGITTSVIVNKIIWLYINNEGMRNIGFATIYGAFIIKI